MTAVNQLSILSSNSGYINFYYDADGNILLKTDGTNGYSYVYGSSSNRITSLYYNGIGSTYNYDNATGNLTYDGKKKLTLSYNIKNFPMQLTDVNNKTTQYRYDENGNKVYKYNTSVNEFYFVDPSGKELASYDAYTKKLKSVNLYGNDMIGRVNVTWDIELVPAKRYDERFYYIKDHLGNNRFTIDTTGVTVMFNDYTPFGGYRSSRETGYKMQNKKD